MRTWNRLREGEEGVAAAMLVVVMMTLFAAGAIAVDLGSMWATKRTMIIDTDAAALAGAQLALDDGCESDAVETEAQQYLELNTAEPVAADDVAISVDCGTKTVKVDHISEADVTFAGALGVDELNVFASSTASFDEERYEGLRPFAVCMTNPDVAAWANGEAGAIYRFPYAQSWQSTGGLAGGACGGSSGDWGLVCFDKTFESSNNCNANRLEDLILEGYDGPVNLGEEEGVLNDEDCKADADHPGPDGCDAESGDVAGQKSALEEIQCDEPVADDCEYRFSILGIRGWDSSTSPDQVLPTHFIGVVLRDFKMTGAMDSRYLEFELYGLWDAGATTKDSGKPGFGVAICSHDGDPSGAAGC